MHILNGAVSAFFLFSSELQFKIFDLKKGGKKVRTDDSKYKGRREI